MRETCERHPGDTREEWLITRTAAILAGRGHKQPTFVSPTVPGASLTSNDEVFEAHRRHLHAAYGRDL